MRNTSIPVCIFVHVFFFYVRIHTLYVMVVLRSRRKSQGILSHCVGRLIAVADENRCREKRSLYRYAYFVCSRNTLICHRRIGRIYFIFTETHRTSCFLFTTCEIWERSTKPFICSLRDEIRINRVVAWNVLNLCLVDPTRASNKR